MSAQFYKYEVAFSYMKEDEEAVREMNDQFAGQFETFIYTERQRVLGGTDGTESFPRVFGKEARIVVIMYREKWGDTPWTRVEEQAIKERAFDEGQDFIVLVNLDKGKPRWYTGTRIRVLLKQYGIIEAAAIIRQRVEDAGGQVHEESALDLAERNRLELQRQQEFTQYYKSSKAVADANKELQDLLSKYETMMKQIGATGPGNNFGLQKIREHLLMFHTQRIALCFEWRSEYSDSLVESMLKVSIENLVRFARFRSPSDKVVFYSGCNYSFGLDRGGNRCWVSTTDPNEKFSTESLLNHWIKPFLNKVHDHKMTEQHKQLKV